LYIAVLYNIMIGRTKIRTPEQKLRKMLKEENTILNLELAIKKEELKNNPNTNARFHEGYFKVDIKVTPPHDCWLSTSNVGV